MKTKSYIAAVALVLAIGAFTTLNKQLEQPAQTKELETVKVEPASSQGASADQNDGTTAPSQTPKLTAKQVTPTANTTPAVATNPEVPTVSSFRQVVVDDLNTDCEYTYSDGSTKSFSWKVIDPQGGYEVDSMNQNGHYIPTTSITGTCDASIVGTPKN